MVERSIRSLDHWKATHPGPCQYVNSGGISTGGPSPKPFDFKDHLRRSAGVFTGHVVGTVVGWSTYSDRVATLTYVEVDEVFRDLYSHLWPGKRVAFEQPTGELQFEGVRLCTIPESGKTIVEAGDEVLAFGVQQAPTAIWMEVSWLYPMVSQKILPQPLSFPGRSGNIHPTSHHKPNVAQITIARSAALNELLPLVPCRTEFLIDRQVAPRIEFVVPT